MSSPNPVKAPPHVHALLTRLHALSLEQDQNLDRAAGQAMGFDNYMRDKFVALEEDKCQFVYQIATAIRAQNIVEVNFHIQEQHTQLIISAGTSFGVSTIYLALALNAVGGHGKVIATEYEPSKAAKAREYWQEAGEDVFRRIELREGDLRETLKENVPTVDLLLLDIWAPMALPALKAVESRLRPGSVIITDNSIGSAERYADLLAYLRADGGRFSNMTLPFHKGLELTVVVA